MNSHYITHLKQILQFESLENHPIGIKIASILLNFALSGWIPASSNQHPVANLTNSGSYLFGRKTRPS